MKKILTLVIAFISIMTYSQTGNVGINTSTPSAALDIVSKDNTSATKALEINNSSNTEMLTVLNDGNVGIGTSTPRGTLDINSTDGGLILPRLNSTQRDALVLGRRPNGIMIWNTDISKVQVNTGTDPLPLWSNLEVSSSTINTVYARQSNVVATNVIVGNNIRMGQLLFDNTGGFVTYDSTTNRFMLKAGKTYSLEFSANWVKGATGSYARFKWRNVTTNTQIGVAQHYEWSASTNSIGGGGNAFAFISPSVDTEVEIVLTNTNDGGLQIGDSANGTSYPSVKILILN